MSQNPTRPSRPHFAVKQSPLESTLAGYETYRPPSAVAGAPPPGDKSPDGFTDPRLRVTNYATHVDCGASDIVTGSRLVNAARTGRI